MAFSLALGVTPERLQGKSKDVQSAVDAINLDIQNLHNELNGTNGYWKGEAGDLHRQKLEERMNEINQMVERLRTYPERILEMAGIYKKAEEYNESVAAAMVPDIQMR